MASRLMEYSCVSSRVKARVIEVNVLEVVQLNHHQFVSEVRLGSVGCSSRAGRSREDKREELVIKEEKLWR